MKKLGWVEHLPSEGSSVWGISSAGRKALLAAAVLKEKEEQDA